MQNINRKSTIRVMQDSQILLRQAYGGVSRYHYELYKGMKKRGVEVITPVLFGCNKYFEGVLYGKAYEKLYKNVFLRYFTYVVNDVYCFFAIIMSFFKGKKINVIHLSWYACFYPKIIKKILGKNAPVIVITIHDMIHEIYHNQIHEFKHVIKQKKRMIDICDCCICVSNNTQKDLLKFYPFISNKVVTIYHGYDLPQSKEETIDNGKYILFVGMRSGYKNFEHVCEVMRILSEEKVICMCIGEPFTNKEIAYFHEMGIQNVMKAVKAADSMLHSYYSRAVCLLYPSFYEGFGFPILEAFANECPTILTKRSCFPEIADDAALYIDGTDASETADRIRILMKDESLRRELIAKGKKRLEQFSWEKTINSTLDEYYKALDNRM